MKVRIFLLISIVFFIIPQSVFAKDYRISGKILDSNNNPVAQGIVVFVDNNGKSTKAVISDTSGMYNAVVANGVYSINISGPKGSGLTKITTKDQAISNDTTLDFTLNAPDIKNAKKQNSNYFYILAALGTLLVVTLLGFGYFYISKKKKPPLTEV